MKKEKYDIVGMTCVACSAHINDAVNKVKGVTSVNVNLLQNTMIVQFDENVCDSQKIIDAVKNSGYDAKLYFQNKNNITKRQTDNNNLSLTKIIFSFIFLLLLMYFSMGNMMFNWWVPKVFDCEYNPVGFALIQFILLMPIVFINFHYFYSGFKKLFKRKPNMDSLIALSASISLLYGIVIIFIFSLCQAKLSLALSDNTINVNHYLDVISRYHNCIYFESAGMILCFVSLGKYFENLSKKKTTRAIEKLVELAPKTAVVLFDGEEKTVSIDEVKIEDVVIVKKGQSIPVDGEIIEGVASINESNITGESIPVFRREGDTVLCSTILESGYLKIKAKKVGEDTSISKVVKLVEEASNSKAPISKLADKISGIFVPIVLVVSILTFVVNLLINNSFDLSLEFAITVIVISCPCALGLATPVAIMVGTGKGAENGLLIKNAKIMEKAHNITTIVFDKTGTITEGNPTVCDYIELTKENVLLSIIYSIENKSEHPLAKAIIEYGKQNNASIVQIENFESIDGFGLKATYLENTYYIGNYNLLKELNLDNDNIKQKIDELTNNAKIPLIIIKNDNICAIIAVKDEIKPNSVMALRLLKQMGIKLVMLTGDNKTTAEIVAKQVGIDDVYAEVKPDEKLKIISSLKTNSKNLVAMVGDGVNDAPALLSADLGIAIGSGSEIAIDTSDIVLIKNDLLDVVNVILLSKKILKTIKLGLFWAFLYNSICILIATGIFYYLFGFKINPMIGTIAMSFSSVSVVFNALTINNFKPVTYNLNNKLTTKQLTKNAKESNFELNIKENTSNQDKINNQGENIMEFYVKGMMCQNCQRHIKEALENSGEKVIEVDLQTKKVKIVTTKSLEQIFQIIKDAGYEATLD